MGTGLKPGRLPSEWEKRPLQMTKEPDQGPEVTSKPTMRSLAPMNQPVIDQLQQADPGGFISGILASRPGAAVARTRPGDDGNISVGGQAGEEQAKGSATKVTGKPVMGQTNPKGMF